MLLSRPVASGAMLVLLMGVVGAAALQQDPGMPGAGVVEIADTPPREATAADRVVESAGFPVVPQAERDRAGEPTHGPIVTVNGRPLGENTASSGPDVQPTPNLSTAGAPVPQTTAGQLKTDDPTRVAVEPPRPQPRPEGLGVQTPDETGIDYDAIAEAARASNQTIVPPPRYGFSGTSRNPAAGAFNGAERRI